MTTNRLAKSEGGGNLGMEGLIAYRDNLNDMDWVKDSGRPYFISRKEKDEGKVEYRLDRNA